MRIRTIVLMFVLLALAHLAAADATDSFRAGLEAVERGDTQNLIAAVQHFRQALAANPYYFRALRALGAVYYRLEFYPQSLEALEKALRQQPEDVETALHLARTCLALGKAGDGKKHIDRVLTAFPRNAEALFVDALYWKAVDRPDLAEKRLGAALEIVPAYWRAWDELGDLYLARNKPALAEGAYRRAIAAGSTAAEPHFRLGRFYFDRGAATPAAASLETALTLDPAHRGANLLLGQIQFLRAQWEPARATYRKLVRFFPYDHLHWYMLALTYDRLADGDPAQAEHAIANFDKAIELRSNDEALRYAFEEFAVKRLPVNSPVRARLSAYHLALGDWFRERSQWLAAAAAYRRAIRLHATAAASRARLVSLFKDMGRTEMLYDELKVLAQLEPGDARYADRLEYYARAVQALPSRKEGVEQYKQSASTPVIVVFDLFEQYNTRTRMFGVQEVYGSLVRDAWAPLSVARLKRLPSHRAASVVEARALARAAGADWFAHGRFIKAAEFTVLEVFVRSAATGELLGSYRSSRRGNRQLFEIGHDLAVRLAADTPRVARILRLDDDKVMINVGRNQGAAAGQVWRIARDPSFRDRLVRTYGRDARTEFVGELKLVSVDEAVSFGEVTEKTSFDSVTTYQYVVPKGK